MKKKLLVLDAPPCGGKGTIRAEMEKRGYFPFGFSEAIEHASDPTTHSGRHIGEQAERARREGRLLAHDLVVHVFENYLDQVVPEGSNVIMEGFPRDEEQVDILFEAFSTEEFGIIVVTIKVPDEVVKMRSGLRGRSDDVEATFLTRLAGYRKNHPSILTRIDERLRLGDRRVEVDGAAVKSIVLESVIEAESSQGEFVSN